MGSTDADMVCDLAAQTGCRSTDAAEYRGCGVYIISRYTLVALRVIFNKQGEGLIQQAEQSELLGSVGTPCACDRVKQVFQPGICRIGLSVYPHWRVSFSASVPL